MATPMDVETTKTETVVKRKRESVHGETTEVR